MNPSTLNSFLVVAEQKSLRAAGEALHLSQSALSRQVLKLEEELGAQLLERLPRGVRLTSAGELFLNYARQAINEYERINSEVGALQGLYRGTIRLAAPESFMQIVLPGCIARFHGKYPGVNIVVRLGTTAGVVSEVREGRADLGLAFNPTLDADVTRFDEMPERLVAVMAPDHPLASRSQIALSDLADVPLALPTAQSATGALITGAAVATGLKLRTTMESNSVQMRLQMALEANMVAILAYISASELVSEGRLCALPLRDRILNRGKIVLFGLSGRRLSLATDKFLNLLRGELQSPRFRARIAQDTD